jgi:hypothetical protein
MSAVLLNERMQVAINAPGGDDDNEWLDRVVLENCDNKYRFLDNCNYNDTPNQPPVKHTTGERLERPPANHIICYEIELFCKNNSCESHITLACKC